MDTGSSGRTVEESTSAEARRGRRPSDRAPLFVVGAPRSGTTLVYHLLLSSDVFPVYVAESKILSCRRRYGPLTSAARRERFLEDFVRSRQFARSGLVAGEFRELAESGCRRYVDVLRLFMDEMARSQAVDRWAEKTPDHARYLDVLGREFETARFIHVVRDGRDVALSRRKLGWTYSYGGSSLLQLIDGSARWAYLVEMAQVAGKRLGRRYMEIRYEDVVKDLEDALTRLSEFADIPLTVSRVRESDIGSLSRANTAFRDDMSRVSADPVFRWKRRMSEREVSALEAAVGDTLDALGYETSPGRTRGFGLSTSAIVGRLARILHRSRSHLKEETWLGRLGETPLEIGKT